MDFGPNFSHLGEVDLNDWTDHEIELLRERDSDIFCDCCRAVFQTGIVIPHADDAIPYPDRSRLIQVAHHWTLQSLYSAFEMGCILCWENLRDLPTYQEAVRKCDQFGPGKKPVTVFRFFGNEANSGATGLQIEYYSEENRAAFDVWTTYRGKSRYRITGTTFSIPFPAILPDPSEDQFLDTVLSWANACRHTHQDCRAQRGLRQRIPRRVLGVGESHLILRLPEGDWQESYITLSHRWSVPGRPDPPKLRRANEAEMRSLGIPISSLPPVFRDAAILARHLGVSYLWIDSLCILQDEAADWEREAAMMGTIYGGGLVNIAVVDEEAHQEGWIRRQPRELALMSAPSNPALRSLWEEWGFTAGPEPIALHDCLAFKKPTSQSMLLSRGWVHQEVLLAPATLYLTRKEAWWWCNGSFSNEYYPLGAPLFIENVGVANMRHLILAREAEPTAERCHSAWVAWNHVSISFSRAEFTYELDRTKALAGVTAELCAFLGHLFAGHWFPGIPVYPNTTIDFVSQLLWVRLRGTNFRRRSSAEGCLGGNTEPESGGPVIPTWSWLSCPNMISYGHWLSFFGHFVRLITVPDFESLDIFAWPRTRVASALHLGVVLVPLAPNPLFTTIGTVIASPLIPTNGGRTASVVSITVDCAGYFEEMKAQSETSDGSTRGYFFIPFSHRKSLAIYGLAVKEQKERSQGQGERRFFQRLGYFAMDAYFPESHEYNAKYSEETWSYVFGDWSLGRLGRKIVRELDLCDDWMMAEEEANLDEIYLV